VIFGVVGFVVLAPVIVFMESKSPLHLVVKPAAEDRVRANASARELIGEPMSFGWERSFAEQAGFGELTFPVRGSKGKGKLDVAAKETDNVWHLDSVTLVVNDKSVPIPVQ
jgi:streptogramin lyase